MAPAQVLVPAMGDAAFSLPMKTSPATAARSPGCRYRRGKTPCSCRCRRVSPFRSRRRIDVPAEDRFSRDERIDQHQGAKSTRHHRKTRDGRASPENAREPLPWQRIFSVHKGKESTSKPQAIFSACSSGRRRRRRDGCRHHQEGGLSLLLVVQSAPPEHRQKWIT